MHKHALLRACSVPGQNGCSGRAAAMQQTGPFAQRRRCSRGRPPVRSGSAGSRDRPGRILPVVAASAHAFLAALDVVFGGARTPRPARPAPDRAALHPYPPTQLGRPRFPGPRQRYNGLLPLAFEVLIFLTERSDSGNHAPLTRDEETYLPIGNARIWLLGRGHLCSISLDTPEQVCGGAKLSARCLVPS